MIGKYTKKYLKRRNFAEKMNYYLNIGTNIGDRHANIARAVAEIAERLGAQPAVSAPIESEPWGFVSPHRFVNVGLRIESDAKPDEVLRELRAIEAAMGSTSHRNADGSYADRVVDIDIIAIDEMVIDTPELTVPHPRMEQREFVLAPMAEIAPEWHHPMNRLTAKELLERLARGQDAPCRP